MNRQKTCLGEKSGIAQEFGNQTCNSFFSFSLWLLLLIQWFGVYQIFCVKRHLPAVVILSYKKAIEALICVRRKFPIMQRKMYPSHSQTRGSMFLPYSKILKPSRLESIGGLFGWNSPSKILAAKEFSFSPTQNWISSDFPIPPISHVHRPQIISISPSTEKKERKSISLWKTAIKDYVWNLFGTP